jgi:predicted ATPase
VASTELLSNLLMVSDLPPQPESLILDATEGNAFFLEELLRSLLDADLIVLRRGLTGSAQALESVQVPNTLHGAIMSRVDRLGPLAKRVLQTASVIGRLFPLGVLERMIEPGVSGQELESALAELQKRDFIEVTRPGPVVADRPISTLSGVWRRIEIPTKRPQPAGATMAAQAGTTGETQYAFKHAMLAEVTYSSLLKSDRRDLHRRVGEATERLYPDRLDATAWSLAYHFERGGVRAKAYRYLVKAGDRAKSVYAIQEAVDCYRRAVEIALQLDHLPEKACGLAALYEKLGDVHYLVSDYAAAAEAFERALGHAEQPRQRAALHRKCGQVFEKWGRYDRARDSLEAGIEVMSKDLDEAEAARIYSGLCLVYYHKGELDSARDLGELALDMMRKLDDRRGLAQALNNLGVVHGKRAEWDLAADYHGECLSLWQQLEDAYGLASSYNNLGLVARNRKAWSAAVDHFEKSLAQFQKLGNKHGVARAYDNLGQVLIDQNRVEEAMDYVTKAVTILGEISVDASGIVPEMWQSGAW